MPEALPELVWFALLLFCFAFVWSARKLLQGIFTPIIHAVHLVPFLGGALAGVLNSVVQAISNELGSIEHGIDKLMGSSWHRTAELTTWLWDEFKRHASLIGTLASYAVGLGSVVAYLRALVHDLTRSHSTQASQVKTLERELHGIDRKLKTLERDVSHGIGHDVLPRLKTLDREVAKINDTTIPAIQQSESDAASAISNLYDWAKGKASLLGVGTFALAVSVALDSLGLGGLRCPSLLSSLKNRGCGLWNGLEDVLGLLFDVTIFASICDVLPWITTGVDDIGLGLVASIHATGLTACAHNYPPPPAMPDVMLTAPKVYGTSLTEVQ